MVKVTGFDILKRQLSEAQNALREIDGKIGAVNFDPHDPVSIEEAIRSMEQMIHEKFDSYSGNPIIGPMISGMKEQYRAAIIEKAAEARLKGDAE